MKKQIVAFAAACLIAMPLAACGTSSSSTTTSASSSAASTFAASSSSSSDFDAVEYYWGQWRGSVETSGTSVYGTTSGTEQMLDVYLNEDGSVSIEPMEAHADLLTATGTWTAEDEKSVTITLDDGTEITLTTVDSTTLEGDPTDFGIDGFDSITFVLY